MPSNLNPHGPVDGLDTLSWPELAEEARTKMIARAVTNAAPRVAKDDAREITTRLRDAATALQLAAELYPDLKIEADIIGRGNLRLAEMVEDRHA